MEKIVKSLYVSGLIDDIAFKKIKDLTTIYYYFETDKSLSSVVKFKGKLKGMRSDEILNILSGIQALCFKLSYLYFDNLYTL